MRNGISRSAVLVVLACASPALPAWGQEAASVPPTTSRVPEIRLSGRVQTQFNTTSVSEEPTAVWLMRRVRLQAEVKVSDLVSGKVQPEFAGDEFSLKDAYVRLSFSPALELIAGRAHRPFSTLTRYSSLRMPVVEKGLKIRGVEGWDQQNLMLSHGYSNRDVGVQVMGAPAGAPLRLVYNLGLFAGPAAATISSGYTQQLVARASIAPHPLLRLGGGWSRRDFTSPDSAAADDVEAGDAFIVDLEYGDFGSGPHVLAEFTTGAFDPFADARFRGAQAWLAYGVPAESSWIVTRVEPMVRISYSDVDGPPLGGTLVTPGVSVYLGGLNRVMLNHDIWRATAGGASANSFKAMFQLAF